MHCARSARPTATQHAVSGRRQPLRPTLHTLATESKPNVIFCDLNFKICPQVAPSGPNAEHRQLQIDIKDSPVRGATGHVAAH